MESSILELGGIAILFFISIREFFSYLKSKKNGNGVNLTSSILQELQTMNTNHLHSIDEAIRNGNRDIIDSLHNDNMKIIEILARIDGKLKWLEVIRSFQISPNLGKHLNIGWLT